MINQVQRVLVGTTLLLCIPGVAFSQQPGPQPAARPAPRPQAQPAPAPAVQPPVKQPATAQNGQQPSVAVPAPQTSGPQRTTATYEDWIVQCEAIAGPPQRKLCEMTQVTQMNVQGRSQPFSRVSVAQPSKDLVTKLIIQLPVNVTFATNVRVQASDNDSGLAGPFARCVPNGCFAELELKDDALRTLRAASGTGKMSFADSTGQNISVPISFNGFGKAYDALVRE